MRPSSAGSSRSGSTDSPAPLSGRKGPEPLRRAAGWAAAPGLALLLLLAAFPLRGADSDQIEQGARLEAAGDLAGAARFYSDWLRANPSDPRADAVFFSLYRLHAALPDLFELASLPGLGAKPLLTLARLAELAGRVEEARGLYRSALDRGAGSEALVAWLALSLAMNETRALADGLASLRGKDPAWADVLEGMAELAAGRLDSAASKLGRAASSAADPRAGLAAAWGLAECARLGGNPAATAAARAELARKFPGSPEAALADGRVSPFPSPSRFAGPEATGSAAATPAAVTGPAGVTFAVQAGSFGTKENADYLAADLAKKGFPAVVRGETREGKQVFKVFAAVGLARQAAEAVAAELSKAGFAGFVISETR